MSDGGWALIEDASNWAQYKLELEKISHIGEPTHFPCLVSSNYDCSGNYWKHAFVYQEDAELLFGSNS